MYWHIIFITHGLIEAQSLCIEWLEQVGNKHSPKFQTCILYLFSISTKKQLIFLNMAHLNKLMISLRTTASMLIKKKIKSLQTKYITKSS